MILYSAKFQFFHEIIYLQGWAEALHKPLDYGLIGILAVAATLLKFVLPNFPTGIRRESKPIVTFISTCRRSSKNSRRSRFDFLGKTKKFKYKKLIFRAGPGY